MRLFIPASTEVKHVEQPEPCPQCGTTRRNKDHVQNGYCGRCHWFTFDPLALAYWQANWPDKVAEAQRYRRLIAIGQAR